MSTWLNIVSRPGAGESEGAGCTNGGIITTIKLISPNKWTEM